MERLIETLKSIAEDKRIAQNKMVSPPHSGRLLVQGRTRVQAPVVVEVSKNNLTSEMSGLLVQMLQIVKAKSAAVAAVGARPGPAQPKVRMSFDHSLDLFLLTKR